MKHFIYECACGREHLVNIATGETKCISDDLNDGDFYLDDDTLELDLDEGLEEDEIMAEPEPVRKVAQEYQTNTNSKESYKNGTPFIPGRVSDDGLKILNQPVTHSGKSGIKVETQMGTEPPSGVRQQRKKLNMQPPGVATPFAPKKKKASELTDADHSREGLEVYGDHASQDYVGVGGWQGHLDSLQQAAYEADHYGFQPPKN